MAKNTIADLNDHLFAQLERLGNEDITKEELEKEIKRAKAISEVATHVIESGKLANDFLKHHKATDKAASIFGSMKQIGPGDKN